LTTTYIRGTPKSQQGTLGGVVKTTLPRQNAEHPKLEQERASLSSVAVSNLPVDKQKNVLHNGLCDCHSRRGALGKNIKIKRNPHHWMQFG